MKKKILCLFVSAICVFTFCACGKPSDLSDTSYQLISKVYDTMGNYLSGDLVSAEECENTLDELKQRIKDRADGLEQSDDAGEFADANHLIRVSLDITNFNYNLKYGTEADLKEAYDSVGEEIGK